MNSKATWSGNGEVSRRQMLQMLGAAAAATPLLAACQGGTGSGGHAAGGSSGGVFHAWYPYDAPPKGNLNLLPGVSEAITIGYLYDLILLPGAMYYWAAQKYYYLLADPSSSLSSDGKTLTYKVRPGLKWSDGKPVTADDVYTTWNLEYILGNAAFTYVDKITKTDNMTVTFHIQQPAPIAEYYLLRGQVVSNAVYGQFMAQAEPLVKAHAAPTNKALEALSQKISSFKPKAVTASGPFNFDLNKLTSQELTLVKNHSGYRASKVNFDTITVYSSDTTSVIASLALSGKEDYGTGGWPVTIEKELAAKGLRIIRPPTYSGPALYINYAKHPEFADKRARQALAYAINRTEDGAAALGKSGKNVELMAGFSDIQVPQWLSAADQAKLTRYDPDPQKAAQLLTAAGWKKQGGSWRTPKGDPAAYTLIYPSQFVDWTASAQSLQSQLRNFGIKVTLRGVDSTQEPVEIDNGHFDWAIQGWGSSSNPFPTDALSTDILTHNYPTTKPGRGMDFPLTEDTQSVGKIDFATAIPESGMGPNREALRSKITKLARAFNELLPIIPLFERYDNDGINTQHIAGFPPDSDPIYKNSIYADNFVTILLYDGTLRPAH